MKDKQLQLISEQTSPLFRIMSVYNADEPNRRHFENNICAFHIGDGYILSVAHNLRGVASLLKSIDENLYQSEIFSKLNSAQQQMFDNCYPLDSSTNKRYEKLLSQSDVSIIKEILRQINYDLRWITLMEKKVCTPYLIIQFNDASFFQDEFLTSQFQKSMQMYEPSINKHTFLLETKLVEAFYSSDIALYKIVNTSQEVIDRLPKLEIDFSIFEDSFSSLYCLQSSTANEIGRMLNKAQIEGYLEHFNVFADSIGGNYIIDGFRYLIKGYFRFGSSGAPYVFYDEKTSSFKVNAIQSEACPIQLSIDNKRDGNFQYINAIASPLKVVEAEIKKHMLST